MKILHVTATLSPRFGGPSRVVRELASFQAFTGLKVTVVSTNADYPRGSLDVPVNTAVAEKGVRYYFYAVQFRPLLVSLPMAMGLRKEIKTFDLVHIHGLYRFPTSYAAFLCRKHKVPYVMMPHGSLDPLIYKQSAHCLLAKRIYEKLFDMPALNAASAIQFASAEEKKRSGFLGLRAPGWVVPNGLDWKRFEYLPPRGGLRRKLGLKEQPIILFLGRINFVKGLDLLVQAFSHVVEAMDNAILVIAGPDNDRFAAVVRRWITERQLDAKVYWLGMLESHQVIQAYVDADVFVLPSYTESFGLAVAEALACGLPVVISDQVKIWNEVSRSKAGLVVKLDGRHIALAIRQIIENKKLSKQMGAAARDLAKRQYAYEHIVNQISKCYSTIVGINQPACQ